MDTESIKNQVELLQRFKAANPDHVADVVHAPDYSTVRVDLTHVPMLVGATNNPRVRTDHSILFTFRENYPAFPPVMAIGPERPICAHVWRSRTVCLLQESWYPARELWSAVVDFVQMAQRGTTNRVSPADRDDLNWLDGGGRRRLQDAVGEPVRFRLPVDDARARVLAPEVMSTRARVIEPPATRARVLAASHGTDLEPQEAASDDVGASS